MGLQPFAESDGATGIGSAAALLRRACALRVRALAGEHWITSSSPRPRDMATAAAGKHVTSERLDGADEADSVHGVGRGVSPAVHYLQYASYKLQMCNSVLTVLT